MRTERRVLLWAVLAAVMLGLTFLAADIYRSRSVPETLPMEEPDDGRITYQGVTYVPRTSLQTVLLIGIDRDQTPDELNYNNQLQSDFVMLLVLDRQEETFWLLHLNRDTLCDIPVLDLNGNRITYRYAQLALAHTYGTGGRDSCINTVKAVSRLLYDAEIQSYARIPVQAMGALNDAVGGVEVLIEEDFSGLDPAMIPGTRLVLSGHQAELFVRARGSLEDSSNLNRMKRQRQYLQGLMEKLHTRSGEELLGSAVEALNRELTTDLSASRLSQLADLLERYAFEGILTLEGEAVYGEEFMEYHLDGDALQQLVVERFYRPLE